MGTNMYAAEALVAILLQASLRYSRGQPETLQKNPKTLPFAPPVACVRTQTQ